MSIRQRHRTLTEQQDIHGAIGMHAGFFTQYLIDITQMIAVGAYRTANQSVRITQVHHHGSNKGKAAAHLYAGHLLGHPATTHQLPIRRPVAIETLIMLGVRDLDIHSQTQTQTITLYRLLEHTGSTYQNGFGQFLIDHHRYRTQDSLILTFGKDNTRFAPILNQPLSKLIVGTHNGARTVNKRPQLIVIGIEMPDGSGSDPLTHGRLGNRGSDTGKQARIKGLGNQITGTELYMLQTVVNGDLLILLRAGQLA